MAIRLRRKRCRALSPAPGRNNRRGQGVPCPRAAGLSFLILLEQLLDPFGRFVGGLFRGHVALRDIGFRLRPDLLGQHGRIGGVVRPPPPPPPPHHPPIPPH